MDLRIPPPVSQADPVRLGDPRGGLGSLVPNGLAMRLLLLALVLTAPAAAQPDAASDLAHVEAVLDLYIQGHATGDGSYFERAFHPDALMFSVGDDGAMRRTELRTWFGNRNPPADDEADRHRWVTAVHVDGTTATARLVLDYPGALLRDTMTLVKADGRWQIVNKVFVVEPARPRP